MVAVDHRVVLANHQSSATPQKVSLFQISDICFATPEPDFPVVVRVGGGHIVELELAGLLLNTAQVC